MAAALSLPSISPSSLDPSPLRHAHHQSRKQRGGGCGGFTLRRRPEGFRRPCLSSPSASVVASMTRTKMAAAVSPGKTGFRRRDFVLISAGIPSSLTLVLPPPLLLAAVETEEDLNMALQVDDINAYSFLYPVELPKKNFSLKWVESRKPERYSSAAPLSADARQRIVSERVDIIHNLIISVSIGPPNSLFLSSKDKSTWDAKDVADSILSDKIKLPVTTAQKMAESSVLDAHVAEVDGEPYWYYEYLVRKSPTKSVQGTNIFRHNVASTAERDGYLYSLNASTLSKQWEIIGPLLQRTVASFRLLPPTENYVPPYKDPWRFW